MKVPLLLMALSAEVAFAGDAAEPRIVFHGNVLFDEHVYRSILDLPRDVRADPAQARAVAEKLQGFLRRAGYDLATVRAEVRDGHIAVEIDEGRLDKIVVLGQGLVETFRFKLDLSMPAEVFNRPALERQLRVLADRYRIRQYSYRLVPAEVPGSEPPAPGESEVVSVPGGGEETVVSGARLRPGRRYELHILIATSPWSRGFSPEIFLTSPEGLGVGGQFRGQNLVLHDDRWELRARGAATIRQHLDSQSSDPVLTRIFAQGRWLSPPVWTESLRPSLTVRGDYLSLQRSDLHLDSFRQQTFAASFDASIFRPRAMFALGIGVERRLLSSLVKANGANQAIGDAPSAQTRPYGEVLSEVVFNPGELRTDRKHAFTFAGRFYTGSSSSEAAVWLRSSYQHRFPFGWDELWWQAQGTLLAGQVIFPDEEYVGSHLHGFAGPDYARKLASTGLEFRHSLQRDVIKLGLFYDQVLFGAIDRTTDAQSLASGGAGGPALHLLVGDQFQIDAFLAFGWITSGATGLSASFVLRQVY